MVLCFKANFIASDKSAFSNSQVDSHLVLDLIKNHSFGEELLKVNISGSNDDGFATGHWDVSLVEVQSDKIWMDNGPSRRAKWWYSTFHTVTAMIGAGVLSLPNAMAYLGWGPGILMLLLSWCLTLNTMWQMIQLHECVPGTRFDRYLDLGRHAFGPKLGPWIVLPQQLIVQVGCDIVYMVTGGKCLKKFMEIACTDCTQLKQSYWILIFGAIHFFLSQLPNFNSVAGVSLAAAVMSLSYSTIAWLACLARGRIENVSYAYKRTSNTDLMFRVFNALGQISFAFAGHAVALEIQATIPSTPEKPSRIPMWHGALGAYFINAICYFPVALIGYWAFGQAVDDNVLMALEKPAWLIASANLMVFIHVVGSYQVYAMPVFDLIERMMIRRLNFAPGLALRLVARTAYAAIYIGVCIMLASTIGGLRNIVADASSYSFYT
ncbi:hypothetical protein JHK84_028983 [Glycine max]|nr:hypothetical protein JHK84_028983 [Glycine max]